MRPGRRKTGSNRPPPPGRWRALAHLVTPRNNTLAAGRMARLHDRLMFGSRAKPPPLPSEVYARVVRLATVDGRTLLILGAVFGAFSALGRDAVGAVAGCLAAGAAMIELHGVGRLRIGDADAIKWLVRSQLALLGVILLYAAGRMATFDPVQMQAVITPELVTSFRDAGIAEDEIMPIVQSFHRFVYSVVALVAMAYQGGMALYYQRRREPVRTAIDQIDLDAYDPQPPRE